MSFGFSGSLNSSNSSMHFQQHRVVKPGRYEAETKKVNYALSYSEVYKMGEIDPKPPKPPKHKLNLIG